MTKPTKWHVRPANTKISLGFAQFDQSLLSAGRKLGSLATHSAHSEDSRSGMASAQSDLSSLGTQSFCRFCHEAAQLILVMPGMD